MSILPLISKKSVLYNKGKYNIMKLNCGIGFNSIVISYLLILGYKCYMTVHKVNSSTLSCCTFCGLNDKYQWFSTNFQYIVFNW